jgi:hypothetical protein
MQKLDIVGAIGRTYVAIARRGGDFVALAWLPWAFGILVVVLLAFDWLHLLSSPLPLWLAQVAQAPFLAMIAVAILRFVQFDARPRGAFHIEFRKPVALSSAILTATLLVAPGIDTVLDLTTRISLVWMIELVLLRPGHEILGNYLLTAPMLPLYASYGVRWLAANGLFVTSYLLIGANVAATSGEKGLLITMLRRQVFRVLLFIFLLSLSMIPLKLVYLSALYLVHWPLPDDWLAAPLVEAASLLISYVLLAPTGTPLNLIEAVLSMVAVGIIFRAAAQSR